jgi:thiol-disulfide isomerase/thioredoxin
MLPLIALADAGFRNHQVPALAAPAPPPDASPATPVDLDPADYDLLEGGIRLIHAGLARPAPAFAFEDRQGRVHTPQSLRGRVVWVDLWATYCATCQAEFPFVQELHERFGPAGLTILAVCRDSPRKAIARASDKAWIGFPVVDATRVGDFPFPYHAFPTTILLDREGRIRSYWQGHRSKEAVEGALRTLLSESPSGVGSRVASLGFPPLAPEFLATSSAVVRASLEMPRQPLAPGDYFEATLTLDVDPGWYLAAEAGDGEVPLSLSLDPEGSIASIQHSLPHSSIVPTVLGDRPGHAGRLTLPVWGVLSPRASEGSAGFTAVATVQACDRTRCLEPEEITLTGSLWVSGEAGSSR